LQAGGAAPFSRQALLSLVGSLAVHSGSDSLVLWLIDNIASMLLSPLQPIKPLPALFEPNTSDRATARMHMHTNPV